MMMIIILMFLFYYIVLNYTSSENGLNQLLNNDNDVSNNDIYYNDNNSSDTYDNDNNSYDIYDNDNFVSVHPLCRSSPVNNNSNTDFKNQCF